jgi:hypothetical protein
MYSSDSGATWSALPFPSQITVTPIYLATIPLVATPSGAVVMWGYAPAPLSTSVYISTSLYIWRPGASGWELYAPQAPGGSGIGTLLVTAQGARLWTWVGDLNSGAQGATLPLP